MSLCRLLWSAYGPSVTPGAFYETFVLVTGDDQVLSAFHLITPTNSTSPEKLISPDISYFRNAAMRFSSGHWEHVHAVRK